MKHEEELTAALEEIVSIHGNTPALSRIRQIARAALLSTPKPEAEPYGYAFQHDDTGLQQVVDVQQVEWGFEKNNPRWQKIGPVYLHPPKPEAEPFGYWVEHKLAEPVFLRKPAYIPDGPDYTVTPLYAHAPKPEATEGELDEMYQIGHRDGYEQAVQDIDRRTGGDGEYRYCTDHDPDWHTPDAASMIQRIVDRFEVLNLLEDASKTGRDQEWGLSEATEGVALTCKCANSVTDPCIVCGKGKTLVTAEWLTKMAKREGNLEVSTGSPYLATEGGAHEKELRHALTLAEERITLLLKAYPDASDQCDHPTATRYVLKKIRAALNAKPENNG